jgi:FecR protein
MYRGSRRGLALGLATLFALRPTVGIADIGAGSATVVQNHVEGVVSGQTQTLASGSAIFTDELLRTGQNSIAELQFLDSTKLSVGPASEIRLDKFVYDPQKAGAGALVLQATRGSYRFVTGTQNHENYSIKTPYATLGVRGTVVDTNLAGVGGQVYYKAPRKPEERCKGGYEKIKLVEGAVIVTTISGKTVTVSEPNTVVTVCSNGDLSTEQTSESILDFTPVNYAAFPPGVLGAVLAAAAVAAIVLSHHEDHVSPD